MSQIEIIEPGHNSLGLPGEMDTVSLRLPENLSVEDWERVGRKLCAAEKSLMWWIGDWLRYGYTNWPGRKFGDELFALTGKAGPTLENAQWVAGKFEYPRRRGSVSFAHHMEVASLPPNEADAFLDVAEEQSLPVTKFRALVSQHKAARKINAPVASSETCELSDLHAAVTAGRKYGTIYADPPWQYDNQSTRAATGNHYSGMTVEEICALPVSDLAAEDAHLHLWTTNAFLFDCPKIFVAWGFEFKSSFVWVKPQMGIGNYWRNSHEILLTAVRGDAKRFNDHSMMSWLEASRSAHSAKPEQIRTFIERASPGPYLELFARRQAEGWSAWGNQIEKNLFNHDLIAA